MPDFKVSYYRGGKNIQSFYASETSPARGIMHAYKLAKSHAKELDARVTSCYQVEET